MLHHSQSRIDIRRYHRHVSTAENCLRLYLYVFCYCYLVISGGNFPQAYTRGTCQYASDHSQAIRIILVRIICSNHVLLLFCMHNKLINIKHFKCVIGKQILTTRIIHNNTLRDRLFPPSVAVV